ncbi:HAMP domain-containing protein [Corallincola holothuriorum]|uniref:histidine kinase n=1 Tax=Corallincola holothuriorum TaxID=2282215 RepID=A0A368NHJ2_9GAMM|nr:ATP-binding protein [Corallincola holothuriorum]RCU49104.1 HAMP domain-containing protein [Corallincola holothuriorum]
MQINSLSRKLLHQVLSIYFVLTFLVTCGQVAVEYFNTKSYITGELETIQKTFSASLTRAIWELNVQQARTIAEGLVAMPMIEGVVIRDESGKAMIEIGRQLTANALPLAEQLTAPQLQQGSHGLFGFTFPLVFEFSGRATLLGDVTIYSSRDVVIDRIKVSLIFLVGNALIKTLFLIFLVMMVFNRLLTQPLSELTQQISDLDLEDIGAAKVKLSGDEKNELTLLEGSFNQMIDQLAEYKEGLDSTQKELIDANRQLDEQNLRLEQDVAKKTSTLSRTLVEVDRQKSELEQHQAALKLQQEELAVSLQELKATQAQLVESEKMASLGGLVAGVAHEINTPIGVGVTAASYLDDRVKELQQRFSDKTLTQSNLAEFLTDAQQSTQLLSTNLNRAAELIASFKQVAVDQTSELIRDLNLKSYINEVIKSLQPKLKRQAPRFHINCPETLVLHCRAGALSQVFTNLIMNTLIHGFNDTGSGDIFIDIAMVDGQVQIIYRDSGTGVDQESLRKLFDPFFTTRRGHGGSGLGTHILYNLITQSLKGSVQATSPQGEGLSYTITLPISSE